MRTTAIINLKGGVGKTMTVIHLAHMLHKLRGAKVLVVDCDPQCNLTQFFGADPEKGSTSKVLINGTEYYGIASIQPTGTPGIDILAADDTLMELDLSYLRSGNVKAYAFRNLVIELGTRGSYDYMLIDCPPAFNSACAAALIAADDVVIPIKLDAFSVNGMTNVLRQVQNMQKINGRLRVAGILPTMWYRSDKIIEAEKVLTHSRLRVFPHIRRSNTADESTWNGEVTNGHSGHMRDYKIFALEYAEGGGMRGKV